MIRFRSTILVLVVCFSAFALTGCRQSEKKGNQISADSLKRKAIKEWNKTIPGSFNSEKDLFFDTTQIESFVKAYPLLEKYAGSIRKFYSGRQHAYAWYNKNGLIEQAGNLADRVKNLEKEGINKEIPYRVTFDSLLYARTSKKPDIKLELMLTAQYFAFAQLVWQGADASVSKASEWYLPRKKVSYEQFLDSMIKSPSKFTATQAPPVYRQYDLLKGFLVKYRELDRLDHWPRIIADQKSYRPGDSSQIIIQIKKRLFELADLKGDTSSIYYDEELLKAMKSFQSRHGMSADGVIGIGTINELNVPLKTRIRQIMVNMERSRWLPVQLNSDYLAVNIPEFKLHVYQKDSLQWSGNVVVGQSVHKTVIFSGDMKYIVFSPYWNVPPSIVRNEILPAMRKNRGYINQHRMEITGYSEGLPTVRQKPGPGNSLGQVKFLFPNSYNIYLHDTPSKSLFGENERAFSHGCIRVQDPAKLAAFLLRNDPSWNDQKISAAMNSGKEKYITLKDKVPVFIAYFTAFTDRENRLNFRKDIYNRDEVLANMLLNGE
ncbi:L,D-transpeptidase family protein [Pedobacter metabolipauper]|uniref:Murein L,D-transpeptidase YcbB/YkuD n=1 Tax=Pedobacter metabolipauper TaxID=425513 RepID=A0A4R6T1J4_9SPHI|nr:L,D-transpeptidase family protein [Pedobacter metabolipauper]TDQ11350.1 murein L,D-transpeptidase YcbB/YkuD [Pedobacter metabolipauper]